MPKPRSMGLVLALALTLAASWYAATLETPDDEELVAARETAPGPEKLLVKPQPVDQRPADEAPRPAGATALRMEPALGNLFAAHSWQPPPPPPPAAAPAPPPRAPALPFRYLGRLEEDGQVVVFLAENTQTRVVRQGDQWASYRVDEITPQGMRLTYLPLNETQRLLFGNSQ